MSRLAILGAGAWGTALAVSFAGRHEVALWGRDSEHQAAMARARENTALLPGIPLPDSVSVETAIDVALANVDLVLVATPVAGLRASLREVARLAPQTPVLWACKGLEAGSGKLPHQVAAEVLAPTQERGALTGPSFAQEVALGLPTALTLAGSSPAGDSLAFARHWVDALHHPRLRIYASDDIIGAEVGGAVKNVLAIAAGACDGLGFGHNARAALITRGLAEITRFGQALGGRAETFTGLTGMGDLILTCTGDLSRNRRVGLELARGKSLAQILQELGHVAEGVPTAREVAGRAAALGVDMPITTAVNAALLGEISARDAVEQLMTRMPKTEVQGPAKS